MSARHDRRRLLLSEESLADAQSWEGAVADGEPATAASKEAESDKYARPARSFRQRRIGELIPSRPWTIVAVVAVLLTFVGGIEILHVWLSPVAGGSIEGDRGALDLGGSRNVGQWFASMLLGLESLVAIYIYSLRRHRIDDYHGRYRAWIWFALACLVASLCETTDVSAVARAACDWLARAGSLNAALVWIAAVGTGVAVLAVRLLLEARRSRAAMVAIVLASISFSLGTAAARDDLISVADSTRPMVARGSWLVGYVWLMASFLSYARHVVQELEGAVVAAPKRKRKAAAVAAKSAKVATDSESEQSTSLRPRTAAETAPSSSAAPGGLRLRMDTSITPSAKAASSSGGGDASSRMPSRAERKKLRREMRRAA